VQKARSIGLRAIALTDHDTTDGLSVAAAASENEIEIIPGIELSSARDGNEVHLLGYFIDPGNKDLQQHLEWCRDMRVERTARICNRLQKLGIPVTLEMVLEKAGDGSLGRPHVALVMIDQGAVGSIKEAFDRYLGTGRPAWEPRANVDPTESIAVITSAGGIAVMAHPLSLGNQLGLLPELITAGLQGLEAYYGEYDEMTRTRLVGVADEHGLLATGGSDYHGDGFKEGRSLGSVPIPARVVAELKALAIANQTT
jgi:predicted metal-dependent phosphoesterase TrpH